MDKVYTLVIEGECPAVNASSDVYIQHDGIQHFSGKIVGVMFDDALKLAWNAAKEQVISQGEVYQHGRKAGFSAAIDEAVKVADLAATEKVNDSFIYDADVGEKIKELKK